MVCGDCRAHLLGHEVRANKGWKGWVAKQERVCCTYIYLSVLEGGSREGGE